MMPKNQNHPEAGEALARHARKCAICHHPDRQDIEAEFLGWRAVWYIQQAFEIDDPRSIYCHARAFGLINRRRENLHAALDNIVEQSRDVVPSADAVLRAIRAYSCLDNYGRWIDPPSRVVFTASRAARTEPLNPSALTSALENFSVPAPDEDQSEDPSLGPTTGDAPEPPPAPAPDQADASDPAPWLDSGSGDASDPAPPLDSGSGDDSDPPPSRDSGSADDSDPPPSLDWGSGDDSDPPPSRDFDSGDDSDPPPSLDSGSGDDAGPPPSPYIPTSPIPRTNFQSRWRTNF